MTPTDNYISEAPSKDTQFSEILAAFYKEFCFRDDVPDEEHEERFILDPNTEEFLIAFLLSALTKVSEDSFREGSEYQKLHDPRRIEEIRQAAIKETMEKVMYQFRITEEIQKADDMHCGCLGYVEHLIEDLFAKPLNK